MESSFLAEPLDEGIDMKIQGRLGWSWRCVIAGRRKSWMVQLETSPAAIKLLFVLFKLVNFCALVSSSIPGDISFFFF